MSGMVLCFGVVSTTMALTEEAEDGSAVHDCVFD